jgi:hypothetical protein
MTNRLKQLQKQIIKEYTINQLTSKNISEKYKINIKSVLKILKLNQILIKKGKINLIGNIYGRLIVKKFTRCDNNKKTMWECLCECGNVTEARGSDLISAKIKSCGCLHVQTSYNNLKKARDLYPHSFNYKGIGDLQGRYLSSIKYNAMKRKIEYLVTKEYLWDLYLKQNKKCALSGLDISLISNKNNKQTASIDRIDSSKGYIIGNVQWVHKDVNNIKQDFSLDELVYYAKLIIKTYESTK